MRYEEESCQGNWLLSYKLSIEQHSCYISVDAEFLTSPIIKLLYCIQIKYEIRAAPQTRPLRPVLCFHSQGLNRIKVAMETC